MTSSGLISEVPAADRLDARAGATASAETCELLNAMTGSASACLLAPPDWSVLCSAPPAASVPRSLYEKLCPPPWEEPCLFDLRKLEPALLTGSDVPAGLAALAVVPLKDENGLWGAAVLCWAAAPSHLITPQWLASFGPLVSAARALARLAEGLQRAEARWAALYETTVALTRELESDELLKVLLERSIQLVQAEGGGILLLDRERNELVISVAWSSNHEFQKAIGRRVPRGEGAAWQAIETGRTFVVSDYSHWNGRASVVGRTCGSRGAQRAVVGRAGPFGAINRRRTGDAAAFPEDDIHLVELFAQAAVAILKPPTGERRRSWRCGKNKPAWRANCTMALRKTWPRCCCGRTCASRPSAPPTPRRLHSSKRSAGGCKGDPGSAGHDLDASQSGVGRLSAGRVAPRTDRAV